MKLSRVLEDEQYNRFPPVTVGLDKKDKFSNGTHKLKSVQVKFIIKKQSHILLCYVYDQTSIHRIHLCLIYWTK